MALEGLDAVFTWTAIFPLTLFRSMPPRIPLALASLAIFGGSGESGISDKELKSIIATLAAGNKVAFKGVQLDPQNHFYILGLAPNAARVSVRFFIVDTFGSFMVHMEEHFRRLEIPRPASDRWESIPMWLLLAATVNQKAASKAPLPHMAGAVLRSILAGHDYPAALYQATMLRIRAELEVTHVRAAILKAYLLKNNAGKTALKEEMTLPIRYTEESSAFLLGCLMALLEKIQQEAIKGINRTIADKFLSTACASPALVFDNLLKNSCYHIRKVHDRYKRRKALQELLYILHQKEPLGIPEQLDHVQRGEFMIGYYLKNLELWTSTETEEEKGHV